MKSARSRLCLLLAALSVSCGARAQTKLPVSDSLSLEQAVSLALDHHPSIRIAAANLEGANAGLTGAVSGYYPTITGTASVARTDGAFVLNPSFPPRNQSYNTYSTGMQIQETIFDFGRTIGKVSAGGGFVDAAGFDQEGTRQSVVTNVEIAYYALMQSSAIAIVDSEAVDQAREHLKQAQAFYTVGRRPQSDVTKAEVDLANSEVSLIQARNQVRLARVGLENAMGVHFPGGFRVREAFEVPPFSTTLDSAETAAFQGRPEILAARARVEADKSLVSATWDQNLPVISAAGTWTWSNFDFPLFSRWNAGVTLTLPIFQGFAISAQVDQARATADAAQAALELLNESVRQEVEQDYLSVREAQERIDAATKLQQQAEENFRLADRQYAAGVGTALDVEDARLSLSNARITKIQALVDYNSFLARLKRSTGAIPR
jgi:outer membrane protein TolC